jgi:putative alpha-1,2-mannosidase
MLKGGTMNVVMGSKPNKQRGINAADFPYSFSVNDKGK